MEGERYTHSLCLWRDKFCGSQPHMQTRWIHFNEAQLSERLWGTDKPTLPPISENDYQRKVNTADNARLDISVRGQWNSCEKTFFNIRITHPSSKSYSGKSLAEIYQQHEKEKDKYNQRVIDIEKSSFHPLVFTTGGMAPECNRVNKWLAEKIAEKRRSHMHLSWHT